MVLVKWIWVSGALLFAPGWLWSQGHVDASAAAGRIFTIDNCVNRFDVNKTVRTSAGYQYWFIDRTFLDGRTIKLSVVAPHSATHEPHQHTEDEFFVVLEGTAEFILDSEKARGESYTSFYCPPARYHGIRNAGEDTLKYLVIKKYGAELQDSKK